MRRAAVFSVLVLAALTARALAATVAISPAGARAHVGDRVTVTGVVSDAYHEGGSGETVIEMGPSFSAVYYADSNGLPFPDPVGLEGHTISVTGTVQMDEGKPEIVANAPSQVQVGR